MAVHHPTYGIHWIPSTSVPSNLQKTFNKVILLLLFFIVLLFTTLLKTFSVSLHLLALLCLYSLLMTVPLLDPELDIVSRKNSLVAALQFISLISIMRIIMISALSLLSLLFIPTTLLTLMLLLSPSTSYSTFCSTSQQSLLPHLSINVVLPLHPTLFCSSSTTSSQYRRWWFISSWYVPHPAVRLQCFVHSMPFLYPLNSQYYLPYLYSRYSLLLRQL